MPLLKPGHLLLPRQREAASEEREPKLAQRVGLDLTTVSALWPKKDFQLIRECRSPTSARRFHMSSHCPTKDSRREQLNHVAKMLCQRRSLNGNSVWTEWSGRSSVMEGINLTFRQEMWR